MTTIQVSTADFRIFLALTGHAFEPSNDPDSSHGFFWAWRWLRNKAVGHQEWEAQLHG